MNVLASAPRQSPPVQLRYARNVRSVGDWLRGRVAWRDSTENYIAQQIRQRSRIPGREQLAVDARLDDFRQSRNAARDYRDPSGARFQRTEWRVLTPQRRHDDA